MITRGQRTTTFSIVDLAGKENVNDVRTKEQQMVGSSINLDLLELTKIFDQLADSNQSVVHGRGCKLTEILFDSFKKGYIGLICTASLQAENTKATIRLVSTIS